MDAAKIDEINILQATLPGMQWATLGVMNIHHKNYMGVGDGGGVTSLGAACAFCQEANASLDHAGCYVVCGATDERGMAIPNVVVVATHSAAASAGQTTTTTATSAASTSTTTTTTILPPFMP